MRSEAQTLPVLWLEKRYDARSMEFKPLGSLPGLLGGWTLQTFATRKQSRQPLEPEEKEMKLKWDTREVLQQKYYDGKPGQYLAYCIACNCTFIGDKRDWLCPVCEAFHLSKNDKAFFWLKKP